MSLEKAVLDISVIEFGKLREEMEDRIEHIKTISKEPGQHIMVDENMALSILPEFEPRAKEIWQEIRNLRHQNQNATAYMAFSLEVLKKYNIPINADRADQPHDSNLENVRIQENIKLHSLISHLKEDFQNEKINAATFEKTKKAHETAYAERISEVTKAKDELQKFIDSLSTGA
jgi:hypothetical protein